MDIRWQIEMLGGLRAVQGDHVLTRFRSQKTGALLAYLAYFPRHSHLRDALIELFWPDGDPSAGRNNLSRELSWLRQHLEPPSLPPGTLIAADRAAIGLTPEAVATDVAAFEAALRAAERARSPIERARHLAEAIEGYGGELLPGYYDGWVLQEREWLAGRYFQALGELLVHLEQAGELPLALEYARRGVRADPLREDAHRDLMRLLAAAGQPEAALRQYRELKRLLKQELDAEPAAATQALARDIKRLPVRSPQFFLSSPIPEPPKPVAHPHNLPLQLTSFIGRVQQMAEVHQLLATSRLVTLTGAGGCGKTRLALQVAANLVVGYPEGVWLVELAALADPALVPQAVASALGVREESSRPLITTLSKSLQPKQALLLIDNCEHLLAACAQLADALLRSCPSLRMLATSREGLGIAGEQTYRVPALSLPQPRHLPPVERLTEYEAIRLFVERAVSAEPSFAITEQNAPSVVQLCQRLDGIPLAIELAAARVKALPVEKLNERLDDMFRLLTGGSRTALPRQQTLRALIDWSYDLLSPSERALLRRLSVFAGGWTLEAVEPVCAGERVEEWEVLDLLTSLVEKSLVLYEERGGEGRYRLLETVRQYGRDRLLEAGELEAVWRRHRDWFLALAEEAEPGFGGESQKAWLERLEREHDNLRAALAWSRAQGQGEAGLRLGGALWWFWNVRGYLGEGREHLARLLALPEAEARTAARAKALRGAGGLADAQGDRAAARALLEESLAIYRELGDKRGIASALGNLGHLDHDRGECAAAQALWEESMAIFRELGDKQSIALLLRYLGSSAHQRSDYGTAQALWEESLAICRELGDKQGIVYALTPLGWAARGQEDYEEARALLEESLALHRELGHKRGIASALGNLGAAALDQGDYGAARALLEESLAHFREQRRTLGIAAVLLQLASVEHAQGDDEKARALLEESQALDQGADACMRQGRVLLELGDYVAARSRYEDGLALQRAAGDASDIAWALLEVGHAAWLQGESGAPRSHAVEALRLFQERERKDGLLTALENLAVAALAQGRKEPAARLLGAVEALRETLGRLEAGWWRRARERMGKVVRATSLEQELAAAWAAGRALSLEDAVAFALQDGDGVPSGADP